MNVLNDWRRLPLAAGCSGAMTQNLGRPEERDTDRRRRMLFCTQLQKILEMKAMRAPKNEICGRGDMEAGRG
jgi:hypothetical protein